MGARNIHTGAIEFAGQVVTSDLEMAHHDSMLFGELYFIWYELEGYNRIGQPIFKFHKQYVNQLEWFDPNSQQWTETKRDWWWTQRRLRAKYDTFTCDAPEHLRMEFTKFVEAELLFGQTIRNFQRSLELREEADVRIISGEHEGYEGFIYHIHRHHSSRAHDRVHIGSLDGEDITVHPKHVVLVNPRQYLEGRCGCLDCHSERRSGEMVWVDEFGRPMCAYCFDQYFDRGIELTQNVEGPYNYEHDSSACYLSDDTILRNLHGVLSHEGSLGAV